MRPLRRIDERHFVAGRRTRNQRGGAIEPLHIVDQAHERLGFGRLGEQGQYRQGDEEAVRGNLADDMRIKLLFDLAYTASLENLATYLRTELGIIFKTPLVMLKMAQGR